MFVAMEFSSAPSKRVPNSPLICVICGDIARGMNFDVLSCMSCKAFFRRNAPQKSKNFRCLLNNDCVITKQTRAGCSACRLRKCFSLGMNADLIRSLPKKPKPNIRDKHLHMIGNNQIALLQPRPIGLLNNDRSTLTLDEWNLLSNIVHAYDEQNLVIRTNNAHKQYLSLPPKMRSKPSYVIDILQEFYSAIQPFVERSYQYRNLTSSTRQILIQNNLSGTGAFNAILATCQTNIWDDEYYVSTCNQMYGTDYVEECQILIKKIEPNETLIKMMLIILAFSSNCSLVLPEQANTLKNTSSTASIILTRIQNAFVCMMWKYLVYQFGFIEAVRRLDSLVKYYLNVLNRIHDNHNRHHREMVDEMIEQTVNELASNE